MHLETEKNRFGKKSFGKKKECISQKPVICIHGIPNPIGIFYTVLRDFSRSINTNIEI